MLRRTWNAFLDAVENVIAFVDWMTGPSLGNKLNRDPDWRKRKA